MMSFLDYLKSLATTESKNSSKSFALLVSTFIGAILGICIAIVLLVDVFSDGMVSTDLDSLALFTLSIGGLILGGGASKVISEYGNKKKKKDEEQLEE